MAKLEIEVKHSGGGGSGSAAGRGAFTAQDAEQIKRSLEQANRLSVVLLKGAKDFRAEFGAAAKGLDTGLAAVASNADKNASRMALGYQRSLEQAAKAGGTAFERETSRGISKGIAGALGGLSGGLGGAARIAAPAFSRFGVEASSAFGVAFQGGLNGNLIRGAGGLGGATARLGGEIGRSLATAAGAGFKLLPVLGPALQGVSTIIGAAFSVAGSLAGTLVQAAGEIAGTFGDALGTALKVAVGAATVVGIAGIRLALKADALEPAFARFAKTSGEDVPKALEKLRRATGGTVSDLDLMRSANEAVQLGAARTVDEFATLANGAIRLGETMGQDANKSVSDLVVGLGRMSPRILDNIGLQVNLESALEKAAAATGRNADAMTDAERRAAFFAATIEQMSAKVAGLPALGDRASTRFGAFGASMENAGLAIGRVLLPAVDKLATPLTRVTDALTRFVGRAADINGEGFKSFYAAFDAGAGRVAAFFDRASREDLFAVSREGAALFFDYVDERGRIFGRILKLEIAEAVGQAALAGRNAIGYAASLGGILPNRNAERTATQTANAAAIRSAGESSIRLLSEQAGDNFTRGSASLGLRGSLVANRPLGGSGFGAADGAAGLFGINAALAQSAGLGGSRSAAPAASRPSGGVPVVPVSLPDPPVFSRSGSFGGPTQTPFGLGGLSPLAALTDAVGPNLASQIEPTLKALAEAIAGAADPAKELREAVDLLRGADIAQTAADFGDAITAPMERSIENFEDNLREVSRLGEREQDAIEKASEAMRKLGDELADGLDDIADAFTQDRDQILARRDQRVAAANQRTAGLKDQLIGQAGGIGPDESAIPAKLRRAAKKARKNANKERRESLRNLSDGLSTDELAANGASLLQNVFEEQAAKETNRTGEIQAAYAAAAQAIRELENDRIAAELALKATIEEEAAKELELIKKSVEILEALTKSKEADTRTLEELRARLAVVEANNKKVEDLARRAAR